MVIDTDLFIRWNCFRKGAKDQDQAKSVNPQAEVENCSAFRCTEGPGLRIIWQGDNPWIQNIEIWYLHTHEANRNISLLFKISYHKCYVSIIHTLKTVNICVNDSTNIQLFKPLRTRIKDWPGFVLPVSCGVGCTKTICCTACSHLYKQETLVFLSVKRKKWAKHPCLQGFPAPLSRVLVFTVFCQTCMHNIS